MKKNILFILTIALIFLSCDDLFSPANENFKDPSHMYTEPTFAQSFLMRAYSKMPGYYDNSDYATDDAVTNQKSNSYLQAATGTWTANSNPFNRWGDSFDAILYINYFLDYIDGVSFVNSEEVNQLMRMRMKGEAYGMRAYHMYYLLRNHAGYTIDGQLMGVPIIKEFLESTVDFNLPRATFADCLQFVYEDLDKADELLPMEYKDLTSSNDIPEKYRSITTETALYNRAMGVNARQLCSGLIVQAIRSRVSLLAASPAFLDGSNSAWENAANYAAQVVEYANGKPAANGHTYYTNTSEIDGLSEGSNPPEMIWRANLSTNNSSQEEQNFPPTLFGKGYMNPTQNLVDAFPMANGYPVNYSDPTKSGYNASNPYEGRDPRLAAYIIYNGSTAGASNSVIYTGGASGNDGVNALETSTRTGYYMKKRLRMDVNRNPASITGKTHYDPRIRYTEIFLNYAEAANEAWGPTGKGSRSYSAYDIIKAIRERAGVGKDNGDPFLEECKADKNKMRELIRNERRLELCFESFRFWDMRRWGMNLTETARGVDVNNNVYTFLNVEERVYKDYMQYGPVPYSETLKYDNLIQNKGW
ncbi:RagB/SusD family nutrient uptake outer membrane protein [Bacteroides sp. 51]|uniref:RagB/SusD family nutrient uptake outer membrane protein n=1 Tax=Bacteroides sp. 51 TaxID=2302938 RepID=UPI0013D13795|nr:RagB/SusD family nutrient uptake outer membrane protein [Bacteroides sp. 51]NDV81616.1 RagB/SusD family nutrient uptake outer membrane protein [Bacteroides sp. 51]